MADPTNNPKSVTFHYLKSSGYRTHHADGAFGGKTPAGLLFVGFYLERGPIPLSIQHEVDAEGHVVKEMERSGRTGIIREFDCGVIMTIEAATGLRNWLNKQLEKVPTEETQEKP